MADFGSSEAGKKGGRAAAKKMTAEQRKQRARAAAESRWTKAGKAPTPAATHAGTIALAEGKIQISCAVLEGSKRVLTQESFLTAIGRAGKAKAGTGNRTRSNGVDELPPFLSAKNLKPLISKELQGSMNPVVYRSVNGQLAYGYDAALLPKVCEVYLTARDNGSLLKSQAHIAQACDILMRGLAHVGITALVDEATGYERDKSRNELAKILEAFVATELQKWLPTFPLEFYELICEVRNEPIERAYKRPAYFGHLTNNLVYSRLAPGVLQELRKKNPTQGGGNRKHKHFQFLTPEMGHPKLKEHLEGVKTALKIAKKTETDWDGFLELLDVTHEKYQPMPLFDQPVDES